MAIDYSVTRPAPPPPYRARRLATAVAAGIGCLMVGGTAFAGPPIPATHVSSVLTTATTPFGAAGSLGTCDSTVTVCPLPAAPPPVAPPVTPPPPATPPPATPPPVAPPPVTPPPPVAPPPYTPPPYTPPPPVTPPPPAPPPYVPPPPVTPPPATPPPVAPPPVAPPPVAPPPYVPPSGPPAGNPTPPPLTYTWVLVSSGVYECSPGNSLTNCIGGQVPHSGACDASTAGASKLTATAVVPKNPRDKAYQVDSYTCQGS